MGKVIGILLDRLTTGLSHVAGPETGGDILRRLMAVKIRELATDFSDELERGEVVSDKEIEELRDALDGIRRLQASKPAKED